MAMTIITARRFTSPPRLLFRIHLDTTKMDPLDASKPDPRYVLTIERPVPDSWKDRTAPQRNAFLAELRTEITALANARLAELTEEEAGGIALPFEGQTL